VRVWLVVCKELSLCVRVSFVDPKKCINIGNSCVFFFVKIGFFLIHSKFFICKYMCSHRLSAMDCCVFVFFVVAIVVVVAVLSHFCSIEIIFFYYFWRILSALIVDI
jgi:hypothetical protein